MKTFQQKAFDVAMRPLTWSILMGLVLAAFIALPPMVLWTEAEEGRAGATKWAAELGLEVAVTCSAGMPAKCHARDLKTGTITELECNAKGCQPHQDVVPVYVPYD